MRYVPAALFVLALAACGGAPAPAERESVPVEAASVPLAADLEAPAGGPVVVAFGDSLTAGYGLDPDQAFPAVAEDLLRDRGVPVRIVNEGVSGDTTVSALARVDSALTHDPDWALIALGANDGLRGLSVEAMEANLRAIIERFRRSGARVALAGMRLPPNYGPEYVGDFESVYPRLAKELNLPLIPFLLAGVAAEVDLNQSDGIHPTAEGARIVAERVADFLQPLLREGAE